MNKIEQLRYGVLPQVEKAWNFPLFEAIVGRRSRRFGFGMELKHGPFTYKSNKEPMPLNEAETAMLVAAATGVTGAILCEGEFQGGMVKSVGRPHPSAVGSHRTELFFTNDDGVFLFRGTEQKMTKMKEYETSDDRDKILDFYRKYTVKLSDKRLDLPRQTPGLFHHNLWVTNTAGLHAVHAGHRHQQGPDPADDQHVRPDAAAAISKAAATTSSTSAKACARPAARNGRPRAYSNKNKPLPLGALEKIIVSWLCAEGAMMGTLMQLAMAAMGLGGWMHGGFTPLVVMGGTPVCKGLGFRFVQGKEEPLPNPVGLDGYFEGYCPPYYKTMADAVDAAVKDMGESLDEWERRGMTLPHTITNAEFQKGVPGVSEDGIACVKDICTYIYETYGKFPAFNDTTHLLYFIQAHHLDLDFYDKYFKKGAYLQTHVDHFNDWHKGTNVKFR